MKKIIFGLFLFLPFQSFAQNLNRTMGSYYCETSSFLNGTGIMVKAQQMFTILAQLYNRYAIYLFLLMLIPFIWVMIQSFIDKTLMWKDYNKALWGFGSLIATGLILNVLAGSGKTLSFENQGVFIDIRNPSVKLERCAKLSPNSTFIPRNYIRKQKI